MSKRWYSIIGFALSLLVYVGCSSNNSTISNPTPTISNPPPPAPKPEFLYVSNFQSQNLSAYVINQQTGALAALPGSPYAASLATGPGPWGVTVDPSGRFVYLSNGPTGPGASYVFGFKVAPSSGVLTTIPGSPFLSDFGCGYPAVDPSTKFAYVSCYDNSQLVEYTVNSGSGALTEIGIIRTIPGPNPGSSDVVVDPTGRFVYVPNNVPSPNLGSVSAYTIGADGTLTAVPGEPFASGHSSWVEATDPAGKFLFVTNPGDGPPGTISAYAIGGNGALTTVSGSPFVAGSHPQGIAVDASGKFLYVTNNSDNTVSAFAINRAIGALTLLATYPTGNGPFFVAIDKTNKFAYVTNQNNNSVSAYAINQSTGALTSVGTYATGADPLGDAVGRPR